ncbi:Imm49 family immunity protein [Streptomyces sp. NPDC007346]|uniref:Imm49 family immunity protein n=1 Tax=Streptomyces sp. NPDC007346 TaxID=3154682 RepID=UPI003456C454
MSKADRMTNREWWELSEEFLRYLGALSVEYPGMETQEAKFVLDNAAEAAAGAVSYAAYYPYESFSIFLNYANFGMSYEAGASGKREHIGADEWLGAFCLMVLTGATERHREALDFARQPPQADQAGCPTAELINGLMAYVLGDLGDGDADYPLSTEQKLAAIDAAVVRVHASADETGRSRPARGDFTALLAVRALAAGNRARFEEALTALLLRHRETSQGVGQPGSLRGLPLALAALACRREGWLPAVDTDYLPHALVTGFAAPEPSGSLPGVVSRAEMIADLASGVVLNERPEGQR